jgi:hypothetical protein
MSSDLMAATVPAIQIDGAHGEAVPDRGAPLDIFVTRLKYCLTALCVVGLLPLSAVAQIAEPLQPFAVPIGGPQLPAPGERPVPPGETVATRPHPEFDPNGLRLGSFFWFPHAELEGSYNSNIFATPTNPTSDLIGTLAPSFDLLSDFPRNALNLRGSSALQSYANHPAQNTQDGTVTVDGRLDVSAGSSLYGNASVAHLNIPYGSPNSPGSIAQPVTYWEYIARAGYVQGMRRFSYQVDVGVDAAQYNAAQLVGGGVLPQSSQDASISSAAVRAGYELVPDYVGWIRLGGSLYDYWHTVPGGTRANSKSYRVDVGLQIAPRHIIYGEAYVGYVIQNFDQSNLGSTSSPDYGGRLVWNLTRLTTLTFTGKLNFNTGTPSSGTMAIPGPAGNGYLAQIITANADHELLRNLVVTVNASYENDSFQGITRTDNFFTASAGLKYLVNRNLFLGGAFSYYQRSSSLAGVSFSQNILMLRVGTQF